MNTKIGSSIFEQYATTTSLYLRVLEQPEKTMTNTRKCVNFDRCGNLTITSAEICCEKCLTNKLMGNMRRDIADLKRIQAEWDEMDNPTRPKDYVANLSGSGSGLAPSDGQINFLM